MRTGQITRARSAGDQPAALICLVWTTPLFGVRGSKDAYEARLRTGLAAAKLRGHREATGGAARD